MKTLTQRINIGEMRLLQAGEYLLRRCANTGFVYRIYFVEKTPVNESCLEISQAECYCYPSLHKTICGKTRSYGNGYHFYRTLVKIVSAPDDLIGGNGMEILAEALKEIDVNPQYFFEGIRKESNPELSAYEEQCATLYDADGKFKRENIFNQKKYDELHQKLGIIVVSHC